MSRIRRLAPRLSRGGLLGNTEGPESYLRELDTLPSRFCRASGGTETVITQGGQFYRVHTYTDTDPTSLLLNFDGSNGSTTFTDDSGWGHAVTANGNSQISTTQSKFGGSSLALDGTGDYLTVPNSQVFNFAGDFTVEAWVYLAGYVASAPLVDFGNGNNVTRMAVIQNGSTGLFSFYEGTTGILATSSVAVSLNQWAHVAVVRDGTDVSIYINGTATASASSSQSYSDANCYIGKLNDASVYFNGYIDSLRIVKGQALYTSAFTPPTTALARVGSGSLTFTRGGSVEYLVVGGGGGGGGGVGFGSGGGAGGFRAGNQLSVIAGADYEASVGGGGASSNANGSSSSLSDITSAGGAGGKSGSAINGGDGASGSGGCGTNGATAGTGGSGNVPAVSPSQGSDGGDGFAHPSTDWGSGGGGGAASAGGNASASQGGNGGNGALSAISGTSTTYAGGGGGAAGSGSGGAGGSGGGGAGSVSTSGTNGTANTGGGGGGAFATNAGGSGGSGIVIARYRITQAEYEAEAA